MRARILLGAAGAVVLVAGAAHASLIVSGDATASATARSSEPLAAWSRPLSASDALPLVIDDEDRADPNAGWPSPDRYRDFVPDEVLWSIQADTAANFALEPPSAPAVQGLAVTLLDQGRFSDRAALVEG